MQKPGTGSLHESQSVAKVCSTRSIKDRAQHYPGHLFSETTVSGTGGVIVPLIELLPTWISLRKPEPPTLGLTTLCGGCEAAAVSNLLWEFKYWLDRVILPHESLDFHICKVLCDARRCHALRQDDHLSIWKEISTYAALDTPRNNNLSRGDPKFACDVFNL
ncbi:hypothetical protein C8R48DRAFT_678416 [Suillus tomentosus]|nr:hypothetical protein C8R48DRAFT_678416 [Suillus tomentosus]